jgi:hypothetical protein
MYALALASIRSTPPARQSALQHVWDEERSSIGIRLFPERLKCKKNATPLSRASMRRTIGAPQVQHIAQHRCALQMSLKVRWLFHSEGVEDRCRYGGYENPCRGSSRSVCACSPHARRPRCSGLSRGMPACQRWYGNCGNDIRRQARPCAKDTPHRDRSGSGARGAEHHTFPCGDVNALKGAARRGRWSRIRTLYGHRRAAGQLGEPMV